MKKKGLLVGYARVSSASQSMDTQIHQLQKYAEKMGMDIQIFTEVHSAWRGERISFYDGRFFSNRHSLRDAVWLAIDNDCPIVVTYADRLARRVDVAKAIVDNVDVIAINQPATKQEFLTLIAEAESATNLMSQKIKSALNAARNKRREARIDWSFKLWNEGYKEDAITEYVWSCVLEEKLMSCFDPEFNDALEYAFETIGEPKSADDAIAIAEMAIKYGCTKAGRKEFRYLPI